MRLIVAAALCLSIGGATAQDRATNTTECAATNPDCGRVPPSLFPITNGNYWTTNPSFIVQIPPRVRQNLTFTGARQYLGCEPDDEIIVHRSADGDGITIGCEARQEAE